MNQRFKILYIIVSVLCFAIGISLACLIAESLTSGYHTQDGVVAKKDTVFVKLLDSGFAKPVNISLPSTQRRADQSDSYSSLNAGPAIFDNTNKVRSSETVVRNNRSFAASIKTLKTNLQPQSFDRTTVAKAQLNKVFKQEREGQNTLPIAAVASIALLSLAMVVYSRDVQLLKLFARDQLPGELLNLVKNNRQRILELDTPRRRKRFENKLRFQYSYMKTKEVLNTEDDLAAFMNLLLLFEQNKTVLNVKEAGNNGLFDEEEKVFENIVEKNVMSHPITPLAREMIKLNMVVFEK